MFHGWLERNSSQEKLSETVACWILRLSEVVVQQKSVVSAQLRCYTRKHINSSYQLVQENRKDEPPPDFALTALIINGFFIRKKERKFFCEKNYSTNCVQLNIEIAQHVIIRFLLHECQSLVIVMKSIIVYLFFFNCKIM